LDFGFSICFEQLSLAEKITLFLFAVNPVFARVFSDFLLEFWFSVYFSIIEVN